MKSNNSRRAAIGSVASLLTLMLALMTPALVSAESAPLASWRDTTTRDAITTFVSAATLAGGEDFVPVSERVAVFDNDGTLWAEKPVYFQLLFAIDRAKQQLMENPGLAAQSPYREIKNGDLAAIAAGGEAALLELVMKTHSGMSETEFSAIVSDWMGEARHPGTGRLFTQMVYQPMLELLDYLRANGFETWIVSGGGQSFMRPWTHGVYGIPPEQVVGSQVSITYESGDAPSLTRGADFTHINDKSGKPVGILRAIGKRPVIAVGNSDGDFEMLEWTTSGAGPRLGILIHHTDGEREWAYDRDSHVGRLDRGLDHAKGAGWLRVDMENDWSAIFPGGD